MQNNIISKLREFAFDDMSSSPKISSLRQYANKDDIQFYTSEGMDYLAASLIHTGIDLTKHIFDTYHNVMYKDLQEHRFLKLQLVKTPFEFQLNWMIEGNKCILSQFIDFPTDDKYEFYTEHMTGTYSADLVCFLRIQNNSLSLNCEKSYSESDSRILGIEAFSSN